jgi:peptidoglycan hydrolase-like protein with peptidoglycan-binding domain
MIKSKIAKIAALSIGMTFALSLSVNTAGAVTIAELQAQINALMAQLAALQGGTVGTGVTSAISSDLTVGSSGTSVVVLQQALVAQGHLVMPAGVAMGYFGSLTRAAVMKWQAANGVPSTGYFGPLSRAKFNASAGAGGTVPGTPVGSGGTGGGVITTPGAEGTITVSKNPNPASGTKLYEGDSKRAVLGIKIEAKNSDMKVERVKIDMDHVTGTTLADQNFYNKIASKIYVMDGSTVLASADLSSSTVVKDGSDYFITIAGFNFVVAKDTTKVLEVAVDGRSTWDSDYDTETWSLGVPVDGVRSIDGAGINQYGPSTAFSNSFTTEGDLAESATLTISTATDTPQDMDVTCTSNSTEDECDKLTLLKFKVKAEKDDVLITDLNVSITENLGTNGDGAASTTAAYLYDGSTLVGSATVLFQTGGNSAIFTDIDYKVLKDVTKTLTFQVDVVDANVDLTTLTASTTASQFTSENMRGTAVTESGSGLGETIGIRKAGPEFSLVGTPTISYQTAGFSGATTTAKADFVIRMKAVGADIEFGDSASTTYPLVKLGVPTRAATGATSTVIYRGGAAVSGTLNPDTLHYVASSTAITVPAGVSAAVGANSWILGEGNSVDIPVSFVFDSRTGGSTATIEGPANIATGAYAVQINRLNWVTNAAGGGSEVSTFMSGNSAWRTGAVTMP